MKIGRSTMALIAPAAAAALLLLAACSGDSDSPGSVSRDEAQALNEAAAMLDANSVDANAVDIVTANGAEPR